jgi:hypothetical protein
VLRVENDAVAGATGQGIAQVVEGATKSAVAVGALAAARAPPAPLIAALATDVGLGQVLDVGDSLGGVASVVTGSWHEVSPGRSLAVDTHADSNLFTDPAR